MYDIQEMIYDFIIIYNNLNKVYKKVYLYNNVKNYVPEYFTLSIRLYKLANHNLTL
jgi:hypothetical protein